VRAVAGLCDRERRILRVDASHLQVREVFAQDVRRQAIRLEGDFEPDGIPLLAVEFGAPVHGVPPTSADFSAFGGSST
jgi:hypothetical protein